MPTQRKWRQSSLTKLADRHGSWVTVVLECICGLFVLVGLGVAYFAASHQPSPEHPGSQAASVFLWFLGTACFGVAVAALVYMRLKAKSDERAAKYAQQDEVPPVSVPPPESFTKAQLEEAVYRATQGLQTPEQVTTAIESALAPLRLQLEQVTQSPIDRRRAKREVQERDWSMLMAQFHYHTLGGDPIAAEQYKLLLKFAHAMEAVAKQRLDASERRVAQLELELSQYAALEQLLVLFQQMAGQQFSRRTGKARLTVVAGRQLRAAG